MLHRPVAEPPENAAAGQGEKPLGGIDSVDDDLGDNGGKDDGDSGSGGCPEKVAENGHQVGISPSVGRILLLCHVHSLSFEIASSR